jgi:hypothetical protein
MLDGEACCALVARRRTASCQVLRCSHIQTVRYICFVVFEGVVWTLLGVGSPALDETYVPASGALPGATIPSGLWRLAQECTCNCGSTSPNHVLQPTTFSIRCCCCCCCFWLQAEADDEPLALSGVEIGPAAAQQLAAAWHAGRRSSLYPSAQHFMQLVQQVRMCVCVSGGGGGIALQNIALLHQPGVGTPIRRKLACNQGISHTAQHFMQLVQQASRGMWHAVLLLQLRRLCKMASVASLVAPNTLADSGQPTSLSAGAVD